MTILVTGATGFIGQHLCSQLHGSGFHVRTLLRSAAQSAQFPAELELEHLTGDLSDSASLSAACRDVDVLIHLAGVAHVNNISAKNLQQTNVDGTARLLQAAIDNQVRRIILLSSSLAQAAESKHAQSTAYGRSKLEAEQLVLAAQQQGRIEAVVLRPVNVYGPDMKGNIAGMITRIANGRLPPLPRLDNRISLVSVADLVQALTLAVDAVVAAGKIYPVTDGVSYRVGEIEQAIYAALGKNLPAWRTPRMVLYGAAVLVGCLHNLLSLVGFKRGAGGGISGRTYQNLVSDNLYSNDVICSELGFKPVVNFYDSLPAIVDSITKKT
ncbi:MAG: SDR family NAD(P)-dependent oxidoreductase [Proteobacteria bacterium]|nr:SDR family NAD(P)-dependent oxidoreductase [Pseudomonadota bacterium]